MRSVLSPDVTRQGPESTSEVIVTRFLHGAIESAKGGPLFGIRVGGWSFVIEGGEVKYSCKIAALDFVGRGSLAVENPL